MGVSTLRKYPAKIGRRGLAGLVAFEALFVRTSPAAASLTVASDSPGWRYCRKCHVMFTLEGDLRTCAAGGQHEQQGYRFRLPTGTAETATVQRNWAACRSCQAMFFKGYPRKGRCPANAKFTRDNGHEDARIYRYALAHDIAARGRAQDQWRFCAKCYAMFFDGSADKGACAAGGGHVAQGYNFVLPFEG